MPLYPCGGFSSITFAHGAAIFVNIRDDGRPVTVFYIGDHDPAGVLIDTSLERELQTHLDEDIELRFVTLGMRFSS